MRLSGLTFETIYFEDYLSFLTEVLELELFDLSDKSMRLDLNDTWLEIRRATSATDQVTGKIEFHLSHEEYDALAQKMSFFYYRRGGTRFLLLDEINDGWEIIDPDGRSWQFKKTPFVRNQINLSASTILM